jgi:hypothetical protein
VLVLYKIWYIDAGGSSSDLVKDNDCSSSGFYTTKYHDEGGMVVQE